MTEVKAIYNTSESVLQRPYIEAQLRQGKREERQTRTEEQQLIKLRLAELDELDRDSIMCDARYLAKAVPHLTILGALELLFKIGRYYCGYHGRIYK